MGNKKDKINDFLEALDNYVDSKISESKMSAGDSWYGSSSWTSKQELETALIKLMNDK